MVLPLSLILVGLALLVGGANVLIRAVSALATAAGVPPVVVGLTVVAFGTSAPELVVNVLAAVRGQTGVAFGSIVGSSVINIGWVLALTALVRPLAVERSIITREIPMMILAVACTVVLSADRWLGGGGGGGGGAGSPADALGRGDGIVLLLLFGVFLYYTTTALLAMPRAPAPTDPFVEEVTDAIRRRRQPVPPVWANAAGAAVGLVGLAAGAHLTVTSAVAIAARLGVPDVVIGLTVISLGTTLPELVSGIVAVRRGASDIAIGNVVGSNIFNVLLIGGTVATIRPVPIPAGGFLDLAVLAGLSVALLPIAVRGGRRVTRAEGALLLAAYLSYAAWRAVLSHQ